MPFYGLHNYNVIKYEFENDFDMGSYIAWLITFNPCLKLKGLPAAKY
jgi:hypothetical protein